MKKIALALLIVFSISSVAFGALRAGKIGLEVGNLIIGNPLTGPAGPYNTAVGNAMLFYNFTEEISGGIGIIYVSDPENNIVEDTDTSLGVILKGLWNLGSGKTVPHIGIEIDYINLELPSMMSSGTSTSLAILFGVESMWLPGLSVLLDARLLDYQTVELTGGVLPDPGSQLTLLSGATLSIRWYII